MAFEFRLPDLGEGIHEGEIKKWLVKEGDAVQADQPIAELETDKAVVEMPCPKTGTILKLFGKEGERVKVGQILVVIGAAGEKWEEKGSGPGAVGHEPGATRHESAGPKTQYPLPITPAPSIQPIHHEVQTVPLPPPGEPGHVLATPFVRKLAREMNVDLTKVQGSGPGGRISEQDVKNVAMGHGQGVMSPERTTPYPIPPTPQPAVQTIPIIIEGEVERVLFKGVRRKVAEHMVASMQTAMHVTHVDEVDVTELAKVREREKAVAQEQGVHLTYLPFIVKATIAALREFPQFNASLDEEKQEMVLKKYYHIGIAVDTDEGLMVPVIKNADKKNMLELAREIAELAEKARARTLALEQLRGGSFTITNIGSAGGLFATPIINYPEVAILGVYRMQDRPVVREGSIVVRKMLTLSITFDHRVIDGAMAARFMNEIKKHLEDPGRLLVEE